MLEYRSHCSRGGRDQIIDRSITLHGRRPARPGVEPLARQTGAMTMIGIALVTVGQLEADIAFIMDDEAASASA